jgi:hypothetical protein
MLGRAAAAHANQADALRHRRAGQGHPARQPRKPADAPPPRSPLEVLAGVAPASSPASAPPIAPSSSSAAPLLETLADQADTPTAALAARGPRRRAAMVTRRSFTSRAAG